MFEMMRNCPRCGDSASMKIGQSKLGGKLRWFESTRCSSCDFMSESDDYGFPPEDIRRKLQEADGVYRVRILKVASLLDLVKPLRVALNLDSVAALSLAKKGFDSLFEGSIVECEWLVEALKDNGSVNFSIDSVVRLK